MTPYEYAVYEANVTSFFEREAIENLSGGEPYCPECGETLEMGVEFCPECDVDPEYRYETYISSCSCDCCGDTFQGEREFASGYNREKNSISTYSVCPDCIYYSEYGRLDDTRMAEIDDAYDRAAGFLAADGDASDVALLRKVQESGDLEEMAALARRLEQLGYDRTQDFEEADD